MSLERVDPTQSRVLNEHKIKFDGLMNLVDKIEMPSDIMCCEYSSDGHQLAIGLCNGVIQIINASNGSLTQTLSDEKSLADRLPVTQVRYLSKVPNPSQDDHLLLASYASGLVKLWQYSTGECLHTIHETRQILAIALNHDAKHFITAGGTPSVYLYDVETKTQISTCEPSDIASKMDGHRYRVFSAKYNFNHPSIFVTGGWDDSIQYWDERKMHAINKFSGPHICGDSIDINLASDSILTGSWRKNNVLQIWDFKTARLLQDVPQDKHHKSQLYCAKYLDRDHIFSGGTSENMASVIDLRTKTITGQLLNLPQGVYCIDCDMHAKNPKLVVGSGHHIYILKM